MTTPENPMAFPLSGAPCLPDARGMTLRDYFAGQALAGLLADSTVVNGKESMARTCYSMADAMLAARSAKDDA